MRRSSSYHTKQSEAILTFVASLGDAHITAGEIAAHFAGIGAPIGLTTIYRHLEKLVESARLRRYMIDRASGACYQYVKEHENCQEHLHLKCEDCGNLLHLENKEADTLKQHIFSEYAFQVNAMKTVVYGKCKSCLRSN